MEKTAEVMKAEMIDEIDGMTDNSRLEDEYNHFFGNDSVDYVNISESAGHAD